MANAQSSRFFTLLHREVREYRNSLIWTPVITAIILAVLMAGSVVLVNSVSVIGDTILEALLAEGKSSRVNVSISLNEETGEEVTVVALRDIDEDTGLPGDVSREIARIEQRIEEGSAVQRITLAEDTVFNEQGELAQELRTEIARIERTVEEAQAAELSALATEVDIAVVPEPPAVDAPPAPGEFLAYEVLEEGELREEQWNFSREWSFRPPEADNGGGNGGSDGDEGDEDLDGRELNAILGVIHAILVLVLLVTTANYLLGTLYDDRKDRSILFWRSMPVSEWELVISKFVIALVVAPLVYVAISLLLQLAYVLLMMALVWRMGESPFDVVVSNIDFIALMLDPISGWIMTALLIAPTYAWLLCASALAKRSPFLMAVTPFIALMIAEGLFFRSEFIGDAVQRHFPHATDGSTVGFYLFGPDWTSLNLASMAGGLVFAALALAATVWLRRHRWELN